MEILIGSFYNGNYLPYNLRDNDWNICNSITFCKVKDLLNGELIGVKYINQINRKNNHSIDIDSSIIIGRQKSNTLKRDRRIFRLISLVPTYRYYFPKETMKFNFGIGVGASLALDKIPSESPVHTPINSQVNMEIGYNFTNLEKTSLVLNIQHRCTLFGMIGGKLRGRQWYTIGIRKWL